MNSSRNHCFWYASATGTPRTRDAVRRALSDAYSRHDDDPGEPLTLVDIFGLPVTQAHSEPSSDMLEGIYLRATKLNNGRLHYIGRAADALGWKIALSITPIDNPRLLPPNPLEFLSPDSPAKTSGSGQIILALVVNSLGWFLLADLNTPLPFGEWLKWLVAILLTMHLLFCMCCLAFPNMLSGRWLGPSTSWIATLMQLGFWCLFIKYIAMQPVVVRGIAIAATALFGAVLFLMWRSAQANIARGFTAMREQYAQLTNRPALEATLLAGHCIHCRYDLLKIESGRCPECGMRNIYLLDREEMRSLAIEQGARFDGEPISLSPVTELTFE